MSNNKFNCWEYFACGREEGGINTATLGVCPASQADDYHGLNTGYQAGRFCWHVAGTLCGGVVRGQFARKLNNCLVCEFFERVQAEEGRHFVLMD